jgi:putative molybdopterin biosynthesis protein
VAGCAPLLGALAQRVGRRFFDARMTWLSASSQRALALLEGGGVHVAGVHLLDPAAAEDNTRALRQRLPGRRLLVVNLTRWQEGLLVAPGNPKRIRGVQDLLRARLRFARREAGAGATKLVERLLKDAGAPRLALAGVLASGHEDVARRVQCGAADVGVAIEGVALAAGLDFIPLVEERFDLVVPAELAEAAPVRRVLEALDDPGFRRELAHLPGYDGGLAGHVTTVEAA